MMYASLSAHYAYTDKRNSVTLYNRPPSKSMSLSSAPGKMESASSGRFLSSSMSEDIGDIHGAVLRSASGRAGPPKRMQSLEEEIRDLDDQQADSGALSVLSVDTATDSMLVKLLNYLKDHRVGIVKIRKENLASDESRKGSADGLLTERREDAEPRKTSNEASGAEETADDKKASPSNDVEVDNAVATDEKQEPAQAPVPASVEKAPLRRQRSRYDVFVNLQEDGKRLNELLMQIEHQVGGVRYRRSKFKKQERNEQQGQNVEISPGFPMRIDELDVTSKHVLMYGAELDADHPGFKDPEYRRRRMMFGEVALHFHQGQQLPRVEYNDSEKQTWSTIFRELMRLYPDYACAEFLTNMQLLQQECLYSENDVPQLCDVSKFLKSRSGFQLRPVAGYLSPRDFLAGLAFRVFHTTQYIRHPSEPFYSPEPDCCHELLGHVPMLADAEFAQFSQEIGLASLGASEEDIKKLAILYFFTIEFGLCRDILPSKPEHKVDSDPTTPAVPANDKSSLRVYGAGLLSCVAELKHVLSDESAVRKFDPLDAIETECMITTFQEVYFYNNSFHEAVEDVRRFAESIKKPFTVRYNPYTESLEIIDNVRRVERLISELRQDATILSSALRRLGYEGPIRHLTHNDGDDAL